MLLCAWTSYVYNGIFLKQILPSVGKDYLIIVFAVLFNLFWTLLVWSYLRTALTHPGSAPEEWLPFASSLQVSESSPEWQPAQATLCTKCQKARPERAHHCSRCGICVLRMDHHCPWTGNCVGFENHKFFLLLGMYVLLTSFFATLSIIPEFFRCMQSFTGDKWQYGAWQSVAGTQFFFFGIVLIAIVLLILAMLYTHLPLALKNKTTIEETYEDVNPYDLQDSFENLMQIMGDFGADWFFPVFPVSPLTDGVSYAKTDEVPRLDDEDLDTLDIWGARYTGELLMKDQ